MPFGVENDAETFRQIKVVFLATVNWRYAPVYLNNTAVFLKLPGKHIEHVRQVLTLFRHVGVTLKLKKCRCFTNTIY